MWTYSKIQKFPQHCSIIIGLDYLLQVSRSIAWYISFFLPVRQFVLFVAVLENSVLPMG